MTPAALMSRYRLPEEATATVPVNNVTNVVTKRFLRADEIGSSFLAKDQIAAAPIPVEPAPESGLRTLTDEELAVEIKKPLHVLAREALAVLGGRDYLVRMGQFDHRTFTRLLTSLEPKTIELNAGESLYALVCAAMREPKTIEGEVVNG